MKEHLSTIAEPETPIRRNELRVARETVRVLRLHTGIRAGGGRGTGGNEGNGATVQTVNAW